MPCDAADVWADPDSLVELFYGGHRVLAEIRGYRSRIQTPSGEDATSWFPELATGLSMFGQRRVVLDGVVCVLNEQGHSDVVRLDRRAEQLGGHGGADRVTFVAFDVLVVRGNDVRFRPLEERKILLQKLFETPRPQTMLVPYLPGESAPYLSSKAREMQLPGVVMKRLDSIYVIGRRNPDWVAVRCSQSGQSASNRPGCASL